MFLGTLGSDEVAIKIFDKGGDEKRVDRELKILENLTELACVKVICHGEVTVSSVPQRYVVYERINGDDLAAHHSNGHIFLESELDTLGDQVYRLIIELASLDVFHRDIKPGNIIGEPTLGEFTLIDFGFAKCSSSSSSALTGDGLVVGTHGYIAPELLVIGGIRSVYSELYSLGVTLWALASGHNPVSCRMSPEEALRSARPDLSDEFVQRVVKLLSPTPFERVWK